jgi:O-methyltransferase
MQLKQISKGAVALAAHNSIVSKVAHHISRYDPKYPGSYGYLRRRFIEGSDNPVVRREIVRRFEVIDKNVRIGTTPTDGLFLAAMLLNTTADGPMVECGCFAGGSSAKLSILAKLTGRKLYVCDSFEGLPTVEENQDYTLRSDQHFRNWKPGAFAQTVESVKSNIDRFGELGPCAFIKGWFSESLINLPDRIGFAFTDVDLPSSARDCLLELWPRLWKSGIYASHDVAFVKVLQVFHDPNIWARWKENQPILFGAGFGISIDSPHLGFMVKGNPSPEYVKSLTIF